FLKGGLEIPDVTLEGLGLVLQGGSAGDVHVFFYLTAMVAVPGRRLWQPLHGFELAVPLVELSEALLLRPNASLGCLGVLRLQAADPVAEIRDPVDLAVLSIVDDVDA